MGAAIDPVCKMEVDTEDPPGGTYAHAGVSYYVCLAADPEDFPEDPEAFLEA